MYSTFVEIVKVTIPLSASFLSLSRFLHGLVVRRLRRNTLPLYTPLSSRLLVCRIKARLSVKPTAVMGLLMRAHRGGPFYSWLFL